MWRRSAASRSVPTERRRHCRCSERTTSRRTSQLPTRVQTHIKKSTRPHGGARCGMCRASSEGLLLLHPHIQGSNTPASTRNQNAGHGGSAGAGTEKPTQFQRTHNQRTNKESAENNLKRQRKRRRKEPIHQSQRVKPHATTEPSSRLRTPIKTHIIHEIAIHSHDAQAPHATTEPSFFTAEPSEPSGRYQQDGTREDSTKQRNRGNVAQGNTVRPQQTKIKHKGTETHSQECSRTNT